MLIDKSRRKFSRHQTLRRYLRSRIGQVFFFTVVTHGRRLILTSDPGRTALREAIRTARDQRPFRVTAMVLLPDHLHAVFELPARDTANSTRWARIKADFTRRWAERGSGSDATTSTPAGRGLPSIATCGSASIRPTGADTTHGMATSSFGRNKAGFRPPLGRGPAYVITLLMPYMLTRGPRFVGHGFSLPGKRLGTAG